MIKLLVTIFYLPTIILRVIGITYYRLRYEKKAKAAIEYVMHRPYEFDNIAEKLDAKLIEYGVDHEEYRKGAIATVMAVMELQQKMLNIYNLNN